MLAGKPAGGHNGLTSGLETVRAVMRVLEAEGIAFLNHEQRAVRGPTLAKARKPVQGRLSRGFQAAIAAQKAQPGPRQFLRACAPDMAIVVAVFTIEQRVRICALSDTVAAF